MSPKSPKLHLVRSDAPSNEGELMELREAVLKDASEPRAAGCLQQGVGGIRPLGVHSLRGGEVHPDSGNAAGRGGTFIKVSSLISMF
jgi:hypothetical protein